MTTDQDFFQLLAEAAESDKESLIASMLANAKDGDKAAIDLIAKTLIEMKFKPEERIPLGKKQLQDIVLLAADRIRQARTA